MCWDAGSKVFRETFSWRDCGRAQKWRIGSDRAASFVVGETRGCPGGCGFVYALCRAISLIGLQQSPRKKEWAEGCFDRADGESTICRTVVRSNAEGSWSEFRKRKGIDVSALSVLSCQGCLGRIGCVQVEAYEGKESWSKSSGAVRTGVKSVGSISAATRRTVLWEASLGEDDSIEESRSSGRKVQQRRKVNSEARGPFWRLSALMLT